MTDLSQGADTRLNSALSPAPPRGLRDTNFLKDGRHREPCGFRALLDFEDFGGNVLHDKHIVHECTVSQCVNAQHESRAYVHYQRMVTILDEARAFLHEALRVSGLKPHALAKKAGVAPTTITRPLNDPDFTFTPKPATLMKIAEAAGVALPGSLSVPVRQGPIQVGGLPLIGPVQAGAWLALDDSAQDEPEIIDATLDRRYPHAQQWLRVVRGDSMNARNIFEDDLAHIVEWAGAGLHLNTGMIVEVTRFRDGGGLREVTLKEAEVRPGVTLLWPRSNNPRWQEPIRLNGDADNDDDIEVRITGLLLSAIRRF